jgi:hypothetical protein
VGIFGRILSVGLGVLFIVGEAEEPGHLAALDACLSLYGTRMSAHEN